MIYGMGYMGLYGVASEGASFFVCLWQLLCDCDVAGLGPIGLILSLAYVRRFLAEGASQSIIYPLIEHRAIAFGSNACVVIESIMVIKTQYNTLTNAVISTNNKRVLYYKVFYYLYYFSIEKSYITNLLITLTIKNFSYKPITTIIRISVS